MARGSLGNGGDAMTKRQKLKAIEGEVLPSDPESGQHLPAKSTKGAMNGYETTLGLHRPGRLNVRAQNAIMAAANRAAVLLTENENATEVDYLCHMAIHRPNAFMALFGKLVRQGPDAGASDGGLVVNTVITVGGKTLQ
jgi:hypothetical protein